MSTRFVSFALTAGLALACGDKDAGDSGENGATATSSTTGTTGTTSDPPDADGDGYHDDEDCAPDDPGVNPGATEVCNGIDDDCNRLVDEDDPNVDLSTAAIWYEDQDGDGFAGGAVAVTACSPPADHYDAVTDCNDANPDVYPGATELPYDELDQDCDGSDLCDVDGDGFDAPECRGTDCNDADPATYPGAPETGGWLFQDAGCDGLGGSLAQAALRFDGVAVGDEAGHSISSAGDVDGDGLDDILIGARMNDGGGSQAGAVYIVFGSTIAAWTSTTFDLSNADVIVQGQTADAEVGFAGALAGDVDGDGLSDILIGSYRGASTGAGGVYLFTGSTLSAAASSTLTTASADVTMVGSGSALKVGESIASAGDVDGDGLDDILLGAPQYPTGSTYVGKAMLVYGSTLAGSGSSTFDLAYADVHFEGVTAGSSTGFSVASAGDIDGDGFSDLLIGAPGSSSNRTYVVYAGSFVGASGLTLPLSSADKELVGAGYSVASAGDVDGDGFADVLVGSPNANGTAGDVHLVLGSTLTATSASFPLGSADRIFDGEKTSDHLGYSVSTAGDVDGDGLSDVVLGGFGAGSAPWHGAAYVVTGREMSTMSATVPTGVETVGVVMESEATYDGAGFRVATAGDVNGDGYDDLLVSGTGYPFNLGSSAGMVYLVYGQP